MKFISHYKVFSIKFILENCKEFSNVLIMKSRGFYDFLISLKIRCVWGCW